MIEEGIIGEITQAIKLYSKANRPNLSDYHYDQNKDNIYTL